ncbi:MAG: endonuclease/exonuclease/phosphatase family protein [Planctomycetes bacterium]|nr:endonuclease/exonuclease/phosphatase family protein [Planctomycetota bacterium]
MRRTSILALALWLVLVPLAPRGDAQGRAAKTRLRAMTFNVRYDFEDDGPNRWPHRKETVAKVIRESQAWVVGLQEDKGEQVDDLRPLLPGWEFLGRGRNQGGSGERCSILVHREHVRVRDAGDFWLSDTPDVEGSNTWGDRYPRKVTWAALEVKRSRTTVLVLNTHLPEGTGKNHALRVRGARLMREWIAARTARDRERLAVVVLGDFNAGADDEPRTALAGEGADALLRDAWTEAAPNDPSPGTYNDFRGLRTQQRIDWILIGGPIRAVAAAKLDQQVDGRWPSDHYPVLADLELR